MCNSTLPHAIARSSYAGQQACNQASLTSTVQQRRWMQGNSWVDGRLEGRKGCTGRHLSTCKNLRLSGIPVEGDILSTLTQSYLWSRYLPTQLVCAGPGASVRMAKPDCGCNVTGWRVTYRLILNIRRRCIPARHCCCRLPCSLGFRWSICSQQVLLQHGVCALP